MKKIKISGKLSFDKSVISHLNEEELSHVVGGAPGPLDGIVGDDPITLGAGRSRRRDGDCRYSRKHATQCDGDKYSKSGNCCEPD